MYIEKDPVIHDFQGRNKMPTIFPAFQTCCYCVQYCHSLCFQRCSSFRVYRCHKHNTIQHRVHTNYFTVQQCEYYFECVLSLGQWKWTYSTGCGLKDFSLSYSRIKLSMVRLLLFICGDRCRPGLLYSKRLQKYLLLEHLGIHGRVWIGSVWIC